MTASIECILNIIPENETILRQHLKQDSLTLEDLIGLRDLGEYCSLYCDNAGNCDSFHCFPKLRNSKKPPFTN